MKLMKIDKNVICDLMGCKNKAVYSIKKEDSFLNNNLFLCKDCLKEMNELFSKELTPKSIKNIYKRNNVNETNE